MKGLKRPAEDEQPAPRRVSQRLAAKTTTTERIVAAPRIAKPRSSKPNPILVGQQGRFQREVLDNISLEVPGKLTLVNTNPASSLTTTSRKPTTIASRDPASLPPHPAVAQALARAGPQRRVSMEEKYRGEHDYLKAQVVSLRRQLAKSKGPSQEQNQQQIMNLQGQVSELQVALSNQNRQVQEFIDLGKQLVAENNTLKDNHEEAYDAIDTLKDEQKQALIEINSLKQAKASAEVKTREANEQVRAFALAATTVETELRMEKAAAEYKAYWAEKKLETMEARHVKERVGQEHAIKKLSVRVPDDTSEDYDDDDDDSEDDDHGRNDVCPVKGCLCMY